MADEGIRFGSLQRWQPGGPRLRPDRGRQFAVVALGQPRAEELPIFVDLDTLRDIDQHARSEVRVELGGVLLGAAWRDPAGSPYLMIQHSLRANYTRSRTGSLTFTHETWADLTQRRRAIPESPRIVGWYHTHPGWGVFLSGWDQFICRHFFASPWDVALVLDPCRGERGWFQRNPAATGPPRRLEGYYVITARRRHAELERFAAYLCEPPREGPTREIQ